jgi:hypothetical protein
MSTIRATRGPTLTMVLKLRAAARVVARTEWSPVAVM